MAERRRLGALLLGLLLLFYPLAVYIGLRQGSARLTGLLLAAVVALRWLLLRRHAVAGSGLTPVLLAGLGCALLAIAADSGLALRLLPVLISLIMLASFGYTLWRPPSMVERFARQFHGELPPSGVAYTRQVTRVWCLFFIFNGAVALYTALCSSMATWTLYNGLISYLLMGLLFAGEWLVRRRHLSREAVQ